MISLWQYCALIFFSFAIWIGLDLTTFLSLKSHEKVARRKRREKIIGRKVTRLAAGRERRDDLLQITGISIPGFAVLTIISLCLGFVLGKVMFQDLFLSIVTAAAFITLPNIYLEIQAGHRKVYEAEKLEQAMSLITNSFLSSGDIISAVQENLDLIELRTPFEDFYIYVTYVNANIELGLVRLAAKYQSPFLSQWVDTVIMSQQDRKMMYILPSIIHQMNDLRQDQMEADTAMMTIWRDYITLLLVICAIPVIFRITLYEWYAILVSTTIGRMFMLALIAAIFYSLKKAIRINQPINV